MGNNEETKSSKSDKSSSPVPPQDQTGVHVYHPDWAAMHAYYGPRVALPPYYNSAVSSGHGPHPYMWGPPQPMMPPYGPPYAAIYSHGGVYGHPAIPLTPTPLAAETPKKSSANSDNGLVKKLKSFEGLAMSIGSGGDADSADDGTDKRSSQSADSGDSSDGDQSGADKARRKRSREGTSSNGDGKSEVQGKVAGEVDAASENVSGGAIERSRATGKLAAPVNSPSMSSSLDLKNSCMDANANPVSILQPGVVPPEAWLQNDRELKRERRKQSNRESARRSRLRKQAETEELAKKVDSLNAENRALKSEISRLTENSDKLRLENATLMKRLENAQGVEKAVESLGKFNDNGLLSDKTENLLSRVNNSGAVDRRSEDEGEIYERKSNSGAKLHQLLDSKPRTDAVAAG